MTSSQEARQSSRAFELLHPEVQRWVYEQNWNSLRDVQERAIPAILGGNTDVILSAATASGKTEAAFLPICTKVKQVEPASLSVIYIAPLKALINDQFSRMELLTERLEIQVNKWHGDVDATKKRNLVKSPSGFLLITPESLEALFVRRASDLNRLFATLQYIVVDELHAFIGGERGRQLQSLLQRVEDAAARRIPRIALSATLADMRQAAHFLRIDEGDSCEIIQSTSDNTEILAQLKAYRVAIPKPAEPKRPQPAGMQQVRSLIPSVRPLMAEAIPVSSPISLSSPQIRQGTDQVGQSTEQMRSITTTNEHLIGDEDTLTDSVQSLTFSITNLIGNIEIPTYGIMPPTHSIDDHTYDIPTEYGDSDTGYEESDEDEDESLNTRDIIYNDRHAIVQHIFETMRNGHNLVFANARSEVEAYTDLFNRMARALRVPNSFFAHHGNLSRELREEAERRLKDPSRPATAICTSTLEMGIDIGSMEMVAQVGTPPSVSSLRQRLGRSGRRGEASRLRLYSREIEMSPSTPLQDSLRVSTVELMAMTELMLRGYNEEMPPNALHLSTLCQQILSILAQRNGSSAKFLYTALCKRGAWRNMDVSTFTAVLRDLHAADLIQQMANGELIVGMVGERLVNNYQFYAAFATPEEYRLLHDGIALGTLPIENPLLPESFLVYAGRRWKVKEIDTVQKVVNLKPAKGGRPPAFGGHGVWVTAPVRVQMREIYERTDLPAWLDKTAKGLLEEARVTYQSYMLASKRVMSNGKGTLVFLWTSDKAAETIRLALNAEELKATGDGICLSVEEAGEREVHSALRRLAGETFPRAEALASQVPNKAKEKHDGYFSDALLVREYSARYLDTQTAAGVIADIVTNGG